ncbi:MAG TPA: hypothetical protein VIJ83_05650 [Solirubrobacteraceae bacterium]
MSGRASGRDGLERTGDDTACCSFSTRTCSGRYFDPQELITVALSIVLGLGLAAVYMRVGEPRAITLVRRLHNGSVNDYAAFSIVGVVCAFAVLAT